MITEYEPFAYCIKSHSLSVYFDIWNAFRRLELYSEDTGKHEPNQISKLRKHGVVSCNQWLTQLVTAGPTDLHRIPAIISVSVQITYLQNTDKSVRKMVVVNYYFLFKNSFLFKAY